MKSLLSEYLPSEEMCEGETTHVHHCKQGRSNDRLYITRKHNGYVYYCHHCGFSGFEYRAGMAPHPAKEGADGSPGDAGDSRHDLACPDPRLWPAQATEWTRGGGVTDAELEHYGYRYSSDHNCVSIPCYLGGTLTGYQERMLGGGSAKYLTRRKGTSVLAFDSGPVTDSYLCVLVEDALSAVRVGRQYRTVALCGTSLKTEVLALLAEDHDDFLVWLDMDNPEVRAKGYSIQKRLSLFGDCGIVGYTGKDPKEYSDEEIHRIVKENRI